MIRTEENWKEIEENNKLIATFLGYEYIPHSNTESYPGWRKIGSKPMCKTAYGIGQTFLCRKHRDLSFHYDWNWMMYVVEKIEELGYFFMINKWSAVYTGKTQKAISMTQVGTKKENTYIVISAFVRWYNEQH